MGTRGDQFQEGWEQRIINVSRQDDPFCNQTQIWEARGRVPHCKYPTSVEMKFLQGNLHRKLKTDSSASILQANSGSRSAYSVDEAMASAGHTSNAAQ